MAVPALLLCLPAIALCANPAAVSVTPNSGAGTVQTFAFAYSDADGVSDLSWVYALFTPHGEGAHACGVYYHRGNNLIYLADDNNTKTLGPGAVGSPGHISNSQCTIDVGASSTSVAGNTLTLNVALTFHITGAFNGAVGVYMYAEDKENNVSGVQKRGTWTVGSYVAPTAVSVSPSAGSGPSQTFAFTYSDPNGVNDLQWVYAYFSPSVSTDLSCYVWYNPNNNLIYLADDTGGAFGPGAVGQAGKLKNYECVVDMGASSVSRTANTLTLNVAVSFKTQPPGPRNIYMFAQNKAGLSGAPQALGTYTVQFGPLYASALTNAPIGYHTNQTTFNLTFTDGNGGSAIYWVYILLSPDNDASHACPIYVKMPSKKVYLANDANTATLGPSVIGISGPTLSNSQCTVGLPPNGLLNATATVGPTTLQLSLPVTFASAFYGPINVITYAADTAGANTGSQNLGTYTVSAPVAPTSTFADQSGSEVDTEYADANGAQDIKTLYFLVGPSLNTAASCYVRFDTASRSFYLSDDAGGWRGPAKPAVPGSLSNYECTIDTYNSFVNAPPSFPLAYTLGVPITKYWAPSGMALNIYMNAVDNEGNSGGWVLKGTWTVP